MNASMSSIFSFLQGEKGKQGPQGEDVSQVELDWGSNNKNFGLLWKKNFKEEMHEAIAQWITYTY